MADRNGRWNVAAVAGGEARFAILTLQTPIDVVQGSGSSRSYSTHLPRLPSLPSLSTPLASAVARRDSTGQRSAE